jgi:hypothetical protein
MLLVGFAIPTTAEKDLSDFSLNAMNGMLGNSLGSAFSGSGGMIKDYGNGAFSQALGNFMGNLYGYLPTIIK